MDDISYKTVLIILLGLSGLAAFCFSRDYARSGFVLFIATLGLGFRTLPLTPALKIHPSELVLLLVLIVSIGKRPLLPPGEKDRLLPWWLWALLPFMALGGLTALDNAARTWDEQLSEFINVALSVPVFLVARKVLGRKGGWRPVVLALYGVGTAVAVLGVAEHLYPDLKSLLPGFVTNTEGLESDGGFVRASFSFYGSQIAVFLCILALPFGLVLWQWWPGTAARLTTTAAALAQLAALYLSGYRSMWLLVAVMLLAFAVTRRSVALIGFLVVLAVVGQQFLSGGTKGRLESLTKILEGRPDDTSGIKRMTRIKEAFAATMENPAGGGWAFSGWVHSDFLQIAANLGLAAGLVFLAGYLHTLARLGRLVLAARRSHRPPGLGLPLFLSFLAVGQMLAIQGVEFRSFTILPVWLVWALADVWLRQATAVPATPAMQAPARQTAGRPDDPRLLWVPAVKRPAACQPHSPYPQVVPT